MRLAPLFFVRPGELRRAKWADLDLDKGEWRYMVTKTEHLVPLARQAVATLRELYALTGQREYVFPGRDPRKPISDAAINAALRRMGYDTKTEITGHGFRAMARTIMREVLNVPAELIERQLTHTVPGPLGRAYDRTPHHDATVGGLSGQAQGGCGRDTAAWRCGAGMTPFKQACGWHVRALQGLEPVMNF